MEKRPGFLLSAYSILLLVAVPVGLIMAIVAVFTGTLAQIFGDLWSAMIGEFSSVQQNDFWSFAFLKVLLILTSLEFLVNLPILWLVLRVYGKVESKHAAREKAAGGTLPKSLLKRGILALAEFSPLLGAILPLLALAACEELIFRQGFLGWLPSIVGATSAGALAGIFWVSAFTFAIVHLHKYVDGHRKPLLCLPQLRMGVMVGYCFLAFGFAAAVVYHFLYNSVLFLWDAVIKGILKEGDGSAA